MWTINLILHPITRCRVVNDASNSLPVNISKIVCSIQSHHLYLCCLVSIWTYYKCTMRTHFLFFACIKFDAELWGFFSGSDSAYSHPFSCSIKEVGYISAAIMPCHPSLDLRQDKMALRDRRHPSNYHLEPPGEWRPNYAACRLARAWLTYVIDDT